MVEEESPSDRALKWDEGGKAVWAEYAKDRYNAQESRLAAFRGWARQLAAAVAVVVGLESAVLSLLLRLNVVALGLGLVVALLLLLLTIAFQLYIFWQAVKIGYVGKEMLGPESPRRLVGDIADEPGTRWMLASYYATSADRIHEAAEQVSSEIRKVSHGFGWSLCSLFAAIVLTVGLSLWASYGRETMSDRQDSSSSDQAPPSDQPEPTEAPTPSSQSTSPKLVTPTPGQTETKAETPPRNRLATPTPGQRVTEGSREPK